MFFLSAILGHQNVDEKVPEWWLSKVERKLKFSDLDVISA